MRVRDWKREHRIAFRLAIGLGAIMGFAVATRYSPPIFASEDTGGHWTNPSYWGHECGTLITNLTASVCGGELDRWLVPLPLGIVLGGALGAAVIYIWHLMRA
ncbi:MAG: hypothetical protein ACREHV_17490 [Rhizomicrobium sp.]